MDLGFWVLLPAPFAFTNFPSCRKRLGLLFGLGRDIGGEEGGRGI